MPESYKALAVADLPQLAEPPGPMAMAPLSAMYPADEAPGGTLIYLVPDGHQAIIKMIVCTSDDADQDVTMRCYSRELGPVPLFGPVHLGPGEWSEWWGSLTLGSGGEIRGSTPYGGAVVVAVYGMERTV